MSTTVSGWTKFPENHKEWAMAEIQMAHFAVFNASEQAKPRARKALLNALGTLERAFHYLNEDAKRTR